MTCKNKANLKKTISFIQNLLGKHFPTTLYLDTYLLCYRNMHSLYSSFILSGIDLTKYSSYPQMFYLKSICIGMASDWIMDISYSC